MCSTSITNWLMKLSLGNEGVCNSFSPAWSRVLSSELSTSSWLCSSDWKSAQPFEGSFELQLVTLAAKRSPVLPLIVEAVSCIQCPSSVSSLFKSDGVLSYLQYQRQHDFFVLNCCNSVRYVLYHLVSLLRRCLRGPWVACCYSTN